MRMKKLALDLASTLSVSFWVSQFFSTLHRERERERESWVYEVYFGSDCNGQQANMALRKHTVTQTLTWV